MTKILISAFILSLSTACIKTADQVQREKRFDNMSDELSDSKSMVRDLTSQVKEMQSQLSKMTNRLDEVEHHQKQFNPEALKGVSENMALIQGQKEADAAQLAEIQKELKEQKAFLEKLMATLGTMNAEKTTEHHAPSKSKKKSARQELNSALELVGDSSYEEARTELQGLLDNPELTPGDQNKVLHGLGRVEFYSKNYDKALVYFSKLYAKYPKASLAPSSLLFIGKSLKRLGKKDEAKEAFTKLSEDYPGAKEAGEAKKEL